MKNKIMNRYKALVLSSLLLLMLCWPVYPADVWVDIKGLMPFDKKISLRLQGADVKVALRMIAKEAGFNLIVDEKIKSTVTLDWKDISWIEAWNNLVGMYELEPVRLGYVVAVRSTSLETDQYPLVTKRYRLHFAKAQEVASQLLQNKKNQYTTSAKTREKNAPTLLSAQGVVWVDERTNQLFVADQEAALNRLTQWIEALDVPVKQVIIEARVVEADRSFSQSLGAKWSLSSSASSSGLSGAQVNLPALSGYRTDPSYMALTLLDTTKSKMLNIELSAMQEQGKGKIVANPSIVTSDQVKALVEQGTEFPYVVQSENGASVQFKKATLKLEVLPQVTPEGDIILDIDIHKDSPGELTSSGVAIHTKHVKTQVWISNGSTLMIGGIYENQERDQQASVPFLGSWPIIGRFFSQKGQQSDTKEMLVFLTPRVIEK